MLNQRPHNYLRDYRATSNLKPLQPIGEPLVRRLLTERCQRGFIIVNVGRDSADSPADAAHFKKVLAQIQKAGFLWTPLYGLCADEAACAKSILVYNQKRSHQPADVADLLALSRTFAAESRLVSASDGTGSPLQAIQAHFAHLQTPANKVCASRAESNLFEFPRRSQTKSFRRKIKAESNDVEIYVNPAPCNVNEATTRAAKGEVFFGRIYC